MSELAAPNPSPTGGAKASLGGWWRIAVIILVIAALMAAARFLPVKECFLSLLDWTKGLGFWGPLVVGIFYILACVLLLPGSVLTIGSGFLFKLVGGTITVSVASTLGACAAFWVGRTLARSWVERKVAGNPKFAAIDGAVGREGFKIVLLTRLSPVFPFNLLNYAFGVTRVRFGSYALASWIGMLPGTIMYVYFGSAARSLAEAASGSGDQPLAARIFFWAGLAVAIVVAVTVTRVARRALKETAPLAATDGARPSDAAKEGAVDE